MNDEQDSESYRLIAWILSIAVTIAIAAAVIPSILLAVNSVAAPGAGNPGTNKPAAASDEPVAVAGPVKLYFASGKVDPAPDAGEKLQPVIAAIKSGAAKTVRISGYHDKTGNPEQNAELAKNRAKAVRDTLVKAGVIESQVEMRRPEMAQEGGSDQEARRVEVTAIK